MQDKVEYYMLLSYSQGFCIIKQNYFPSGEKSFSQQMTKWYRHIRNLYRFNPQYIDLVKGRKYVD